MSKRTFDRNRTGQLLSDRGVEGLIKMIEDERRDAAEKTLLLTVGAAHGHDTKWWPFVISGCFETEEAYGAWRQQIIAKVTGEDAE